MFIPFTLIMVLTTCRRLWLLSLSGRVPMRHLVYRVQPLPQSMLPLVWDFGQLNTCVEELYIHQMVRRFVSEYSSADCNSFFWFVFLGNTQIMLCPSYVAVLYVLGARRKAEWLGWSWSQRFVWDFDQVSGIHESKTGTCCLYPATYADVMILCSWQVMSYMMPTHSCCMLILMYYVIFMLTLFKL